MLSIDSPVSGLRIVTGNMTMVNSVTCRHARELDWLAWLIEPRGPDGRDMSDHYPWCAECSSVVDQYNRMELALRMGPSNSEQSHPQPRILARYEGEGEALDEALRRQVERHLEACGACRSELAALASFDFASLAPDAADRSETESPAAERGEESHVVPLQAVRSARKASTEGPVRREGVRGAWGRDRVFATAFAAAAVAAIAVFFAQRSLELPEADLRAGVQDAQPELDSSGDEILLAAVLDLGAAEYVQSLNLEEMPWLRKQGGFRGRINGAASASTTPELRAIAPLHVGATRQASPGLWWHLSDPTNNRIDFELIEAKSRVSLVGFSLSGNIDAGFHRIPLDQLGVDLTPDVVYEWKLSLIIDPTPGAINPGSGGAIVRLVPAHAQREHEAVRQSAATAKSWHDDAQAGFWYESFDFISGLAERHPRVVQIRDFRSELLREIGFAAFSIVPASAHD